MNNEIKCTVRPDGIIDVVIMYREGYCVLKFTNKPTPEQIAQKLIDLGEGMKTALEGKRV